MIGSRRARRGGLAAAALGVGVALALAAPATTAVGQSSPPSTLGVVIASPAALAARGAAVIVPVNVTCPPDAEGGVSVGLSQRAGGATATGFGFENVVCTGQNQVVEVLVQAGQGRAFKKGVASAVAEVFVCNEFGCANARDTEVIEISRG